MITDRNAYEELKQSKAKLYLLEIGDIIAVDCDVEVKMDMIARLGDIWIAVKQALDDCKRAEES